MAVNITGYGTPVENLSLRIYEGEWATLERCFNKFSMFDISGHVYTSLAIVR